MQDDHWIKKAVSSHPGLLRQKLEVKKGEDIPVSKLQKAEHSKSPALRKEAALAENLRKMHHDSSDKHFKDVQDGIKDLHTRNKVDCGY